MTRVAAGAFVRPIEGEAVAGDACLVQRCERGVLVVAADGLGHGPAAAAASGAFIACVRGAPDSPLAELFATGHRALLKTRGAVATIARFDERAGSVELAGIGNVIALLASEGGAPKHLVVPAGVVGGAFRPVRPQVHAFASGDVLVLHTDGVHGAFDLGPFRAFAPVAFARSIVDRHGKASDDVGCVVAIGAAGAADLVPPHEAADSIRIAIRAAGDAEYCAVKAREFAERRGFGRRAQWEVGIGVSELVTNVLKFAGAGELTLTLEQDTASQRDRIAVGVVDRGGGIADIGLAARDGYSEGVQRTGDTPRPPGRGLGVGIGCVQRMMDHVAFETSARGTRVVAWKYR